MPVDTDAIVAEVRDQKLFVADNSDVDVRSAKLALAAAERVEKFYDADEKKKARKAARDFSKWFNRISEQVESEPEESHQPRANLPVVRAGIWAEQGKMSIFANNAQLSMMMPSYDKGSSPALIDVVVQHPDAPEGYVQPFFAGMERPVSDLDHLVTRPGIGYDRPTMIYTPANKKKSPPQLIACAPQLPKPRRFRGRQKRMKGL